MKSLKIITASLLLTIFLVSCGSSSRCSRGFSEVQNSTVELALDGRA